MIDISEIIHDPDIAQDFTLQRKAGTWTSGRFETTTKTYNRHGVIQPLTTKELAQLPEGDTVRGGISIYTVEPIYTTQLAQSASQQDQISDEAVWRGENYKIMQVQNFTDYGYYKAIATRKLGA